MSLASLDTHRSLAVHKNNKYPVYPQDFDLSQRVTKLEDFSFAAGTNGELWTGRLCYPNQLLPTVVVIKVLRVKFSAQESANAFGMRLVDHISVWRNLEHLNVSKVEGFALGGPSISLIVPYFPNGNIVDYIKRAEGASALDLSLLIREIIAGLAYLHDKDIIHGNIHGENIMIDADGHAVLSDIGIDSAMGDTAEYQRIHPRFHWKAPELLIGDQQRPTKSADMYSFAQTVYEIYTLKPPQCKVKKAWTFIIKLRENSLPTPERPPALPITTWTLLQHCWAAHPQDRPQAHALLRRFEGNRATSS